MSLKLQLGDLIQINAPNDVDIHNRVYHILYLDKDKIRLEEADSTEEILTLTDGYWDNEAIESIMIKSRAEEIGYARQNNLINGVWIDIHFSGDLPLTLTGKITNLVEDKIEVTTFPTDDVIFIDFKYQGLPEDLIKTIEIRKAPEASFAKDIGEQAKGQAEQGQAEQGRAEPLEEETLNSLERRYKEVQRQLLEIPDDEPTDDDLEFENQQKIQEQTKNYIFDADQIQFGDVLEEITQVVDVSEKEQRYDIDKQLDDFLDDMLSTIPTGQRTAMVKNNIHKMIQRFKQLRDTFSVFDDKGYALMPKTHGQNYKPLVGTIEKLEQKLYWMLPVVKTTKKIYNDDLEDEEGIVEMGADDTEIITIEDNIKAINEIVKNYEENTGSETNKYTLLQKNLNSYLTPFSDPQEKEDVIISAHVNTLITAVVDNMGDFISSTDGNNTFTSPHSANKNDRKRKVQQKRFLLETYTTGATGLEVTKVRGDNPMIKRKEITKNDKLNLKAILTLAEPTVRFSQINLHASNILNKSNLNLQFLNYWQLLKAKTRVDKTVIIDFNQPYQHNTETFLKHVHNFTIDQNLNQSDSDDKYNNFLNAVIPKTKILFDLIKPHLTGKLSIPDILTYMEPFMIYLEDLNAQQYHDMNDFIREKIAEYMKKYSTKSREYAAIKGTQNVLFPSLIKILDENANVRTKVLDVYGFTDTIMNMSNADFIKRINAIDNGVLYNNAIAFISRSLMIADGARDMADIDIYLNQQTEKAQAKTAAKTAKSKKNDFPVEMPTSSECNKFKVITKRYIELDELTEDNGKEIYYDKKYDTTNYEIGELFKADSTMPLNEQIQHYIGKLVKNKGMNELHARRDAESIVKGKRTVEDGEYAILETTSETNATIQYYVRQRETWVLDDRIDSETFADDMKMFCNLNEKCIAVKDKCEDQSTGANELKKHNLKLLLSEFNTVLNVNKDIIVNKIEDELSNSDARIEVLRNLRLSQMYKYETKKIEIGNTLADNQKIIMSPYDGLLSSILGQTDMAKRYLDISNFVKSFTREGISENDESSYWYYCIKSNKKMLPTFLYKLANTFLTGGNFGQMLDKICALQGTLSDDGDKYVDKYSGYTIRMIEMSTDEEYNEEGFKIITRDVMDDDVGDVIMAALPKNINQPAIKRKYATADAAPIYNVLEAMSTNMGMNIEDQKDFIVRNVLKQLSNTSVMAAKSAYDKFYEKKIVKGEKVDTYEVAYNSTLMYLTLSYFLIAIQTSIPPIKTKTTFPGCKKSFSGFPLEVDTTNNKGLKYVACVAFKLRSKATLPWSAIANRPDTFIEKQMEAMITRYILPTEEVQDAFKQLKLYLTENPESTIPQEHAIESWSNFLPPLKPLKLSSMQDVGDVFKDRLSDSLKKGKKEQDDYIAELQSKMIMFSFHIIDLIEKTVLGEQAILKGKNGEPFVENACCEIGENNTIMYFVKKQPEIATLNNKVVRLSDMYDDTKKLSKAPLLYDPSNTKRKLREIENKFSEQTIYRAFIVYCKFNSLVPLTDNLRGVCPTKPDNFDMNDSLEESIRKLKSNARNYSEQSLQQLLEVVNNETKAPIKREDKIVSNVNKISELMTKMDAEDKRPSTFRTDFLNILETFELNALSADSPELRKLKNVLANLNTDMIKQITDFINQFSRNEKNADFINFLETIFQFKETGTNLILDAKEETGYKMVNFMKNAMRSLTREYPNIILNEVKHENAKIPSHWDLSVKHVSDVKNSINDYYKDFNGFYKDDQIHLLMQKMLERTSDVNELAQNTLLYAPVELNGKKKIQENKSGEHKSSEHKSGEHKSGEHKSGEHKSSEHKSSEHKSSEHKSSEHNESSFKYSAFDLRLTSLLFKFYFLSALTDLIALKEDKELLSLSLQKEEESFTNKAYEADILAGNQADLASKIADIIVSFTNFISKDKKKIDHNYKSLMDFILRAKEKEKDEITSYLGKMTVEEREVEDLFKDNKLGRWSKGQQKGVHSYVGATYDEEREEMERIALRDAQLSKRGADPNDLEAVGQEGVDAEQDREDNQITYLGEDGEPEDYDMDGDEEFR